MRRAAAPQPATVLDWSARLLRRSARTTAIRACAVAFVAGGAVAAGPPAAFAQARPAVRVEPATAEPSSPVVATGSGFQPRGSEPVRLYVGSVQPGREVATAEPVAGGFTVAFKAPAREGHHSVVACRGLDAAGACRERATTRLTVAAPPPTGPTTTTRPGRLVTPTTPTTTTGTPPDDLRNPSGAPTTGTTTPPPPDTEPGLTTPGGSTDTAPDPSQPGTRPEGMELDRPAAGPGEHATVAGWGCGPGNPVSVSLAGRTAARTTSDPDGTFTARLDVPELDPGRYRVVARCPQPLGTDLDIVLATSARPMAATLAVLVFFVLLILGVARRFLGAGASVRGAA